ncbi:MAG: mannose-1-phosphate guanylyltransferase [Bacteroidales bacterium]|nr:mannose-1-phosphate guanylyltransferase [Bacteroidales bacterium]
MMNPNHYCVIMAGGIGARFWPMSRIAHPKQFIDILGTGQTLIQQTFSRFLRICPMENIYIVTNTLYRELVLSQLEGIQPHQVLCEPMRRNTAPCIAYATHKIRSQNPDAIIVVAPSDHNIQKDDDFTEVILSAIKAAGENPWLLTLGITPSRPDTGYGYIQFCNTAPYPEDIRIKKVKTFTEKPDLELARTFLESGDFLWNSGIFIWSALTIQEALKEHLPEVSQVFREGMEKYGTPEEQEFIDRTYPLCKNISIDYGLMEKANNVYVLAADFGWSDVGTWGSVYDMISKDTNGNAVVGKHVMTFDTRNCIVHMPQDKLVVLQGMDDFIVVEYDNMLLICRKTEEQSLREIVNLIRVEKGESFV